MQPNTNYTIKPTHGLHLCWLGNTAWLLAGQGLLFLTDPVLEADDRIAPPPVTAQTLAPALDAVFITHEHSDHFHEATTRILVKESACLFVLPQSCLARGQELGIPEQRIITAIPDIPLTACGVSVKPVRAIHGHLRGSVYRYATPDDCGYRFQMAGHTLYQPGDTVLLQEHLEMEPVDVLFVSPNEHNTHIKQSCTLIEFLRPSHIFPQHYGTFKVTPDNAFWTVGYPEALRKKLPAAIRGHMHMIPQGRWFEIDANK